MVLPYDVEYLFRDDQRYNIFMAILIPKLSTDEESVQAFEDYTRFDVIGGTGEHA